jgi:hypothetical protein
MLLITQTIFRFSLDNGHHSPGDVFFLYFYFPPACCCEKNLVNSIQIQKQVLSKEIILNNIWYISVFKITGEKFH